MQYIVLTTITASYRDPAALETRRLLLFKPSEQESKNLWPCTFSHWVTVRLKFWKRRENYCLIRKVLFNRTAVGKIYRFLEYFGFLTLR